MLGRKTVETMTRLAVLTTGERIYVELFKKQLIQTYNLCTNFVTGRVRYHRYELDNVQPLNGKDSILKNFLPVYRDCIHEKCTHETRIRYTRLPSMS
jgi:hypothetical protein